MVADFAHFFNWYYSGCRRSVTTPIWSSGRNAPKSFADLRDPKWSGKMVKGHPGFSGAIMSATFQIAELIEHEQRMITGAGEVAVVGGAFLISIGLAHTGVHVEHDAVQRTAAVHPVNPSPAKIGERDKVLIVRKPLRLKASHLTQAGRDLLNNG